MGEVMKLGKFALLGDLASNRDMSLRPAGKELAGVLTKLLDHHQGQVRKIRAETQPAFLQEKLKGETAATVGAINVAAKSSGLDVLEGQLASMRETFNRELDLPVMKPEQRMHVEQRAAEIRRELRGVDPLQRLVIAKRAAVDADLEFLHAVRGTPKAFPILSPSELKEVEATYLDSHRSAESEKIQNYESAISTMKSDLVKATKIAGGEIAA